VFTDKNGKIKPRFITNLTIKQQKKLAKSIKRARLLNLMPFGS
jgi:ribosomal protein S18